MRKEFVHLTSKVTSQEQEIRRLKEKTHTQDKLLTFVKDEIKYLLQAQRRDEEHHAEKNVTYSIIDEIDQRIQQLEFRVCVKLFSFKNPEFL